MRRSFVLGIACCLGGSAVLAADPKIDAAIKAFAAVEADPAKVAIYCQMSKAAEEAGDDESKQTAAEAKIDGYIKQLGPEFEKGWNAGGDLPEDSPDSQAFNAALEKLDDKCPD